jgi:hypothetical protein
MEQPSYYSVLPAHVRYDERLRPNAKLLYSEITALSNRDGYCYASNEWFSELYDVSPETISRWIRQLAEYGHITIQYERQGAQVRKRKIFIAQNHGGVDEKPTIDKKINRTIDKKVNRTIDKKVKENTTSIFNTTSNIYIVGQEVLAVVREWNSQKIISHNPTTVTQKRENKIAQAVKKHGFKKVLEAIQNYGEVFRGDDYFLDYRWTLWDFMQKVPQFFTDADPSPFEKYRKRRSTARQDVGDADKYIERNKNLDKLGREYGWSTESL